MARAPTTMLGAQMLVLQLLALMSSSLLPVPSTAPTVVLAVLQVPRSGWPPAAQLSCPLS